LAVAERHCDRRAAGPWSRSTASPRDHEILSQTVAGSISGDSHRPSDDRCGRPAEVSTGARHIAANTGLKQQYGGPHHSPLRRELRAGQHPFTGNTGDEFRLWIHKTSHNFRAIDLTAAEVPSILLTNSRRSRWRVWSSTPHGLLTLYPLVTSICHRGINYLALRASERPRSQHPRSSVSTCRRRSQPS